MQFGFVLMWRLLSCRYSGFAVYWWVASWVYYSLLWFTLIVLLLIAIGLCMVVWFCCYAGLLHLLGW